MMHLLQSFRIGLTFLLEQLQSLPGYAAKGMYSPQLFFEKIYPGIGFYPEIDGPLPGDAYLLDQSAAKQQTRHIADRALADLQPIDQFREGLVGRIANH